MTEQPPPPITEQDQSDFFEKEQKLIHDFGLGLAVTFRPGDGWAINPENGEATYDPGWFKDRGYSHLQRTFALLHEIYHFKEANQAKRSTESRKIWEARREKGKQHRRYHFLDNCIDDVGDNHAVVGYVPALEGAVKCLYQEKLFPKTDFREQPRHIQLAQAIIRLGMLPDESLQLSPEVLDALAGLRSVKGKKGAYDVITMVTDPACKPDVKRRLTEKYIDPIYDQLYEQDKEDKKHNQQSKQQSNDEATSGSKQGESTFDDEYDEIEEKMSPGFSEEQVEVASEPSFGQDASKRQQAAYETEHGVDQKDVLDYQTEYKKVEPYLEPVRKQFRRIIAERKIPRRRLVGGKDEGIMVTPGLAGIAQAMFDRGQYDGPFYSDFEGRLITKEVPSAFELTLVGDRSGSMAGEKSREQRRAFILAMEALYEFMEQPEVRDKIIDPDMYATCEVRSLGGEKENVIIKERSNELTEQDRVRVFKTLENCPGSDTQDYVVLSQIKDEMMAREAQTPGYLNSVKNRKTKKIVAVFSDGQSGNQALYDQRKRELTEMGVQVVEFRKIDGVTAFVPKVAGILEQALDELCYKQERR